eukprot:scaffold86921_cov50-Prasinocladus_malaysianus.AAC.3
MACCQKAHYAGGCDPLALIGEAEPHPYNRWLNYCDSKLCNVLFAAEVARREVRTRRSLSSANILKPPACEPTLSTAGEYSTYTALGWFLPS